jgi:hypothetical protein
LAHKQVTRQLERQASPMRLLLDLRERFRQLSEEEYLAEIGLAKKLQKFLRKKN